MRRTFVLIIAGILLLAGIAATVGWLFFLDGEASETHEEYTPPPLSDDPPMDGSALDSIAREMEQRRNEGK
jgi:hypothetical protein